jgi:hypothetical protein
MWTAMAASNSRRVVVSIDVNGDGSIELTPRRGRAVAICTKPSAQPASPGPKSRSGPAAGEVAGADEPSAVGGVAQLALTLVGELDGD